jgi:hypothetical protein
VAKTDRNNPNDTFAVYAVVGPGKHRLLRQDRAGCEKAIRDFNPSPQIRSSEKNEVLDGM